MIRRPPRSTLFPYTTALPICYRHSWNAKKLANPKLVQPQAELEFDVPHESGDESYSDQEEECSSPLNHPYNLPYHSTHTANNNSSFVVSPGEEQISFLLSHPFQCVG